MLVCQKTESLNENSFIFTFLHLKKKKNRQKNGLPPEKQRKRILLRNFILNLRMKRTLLIAAATVVGVIIYLKTSFTVAYMLYVSNKTIRPSI